MGVKTPETVGEADGGFAVDGVILAGGIEVGVGEAVVDGVQARGAGIAGECDLDGGGFEREKRQAVIDGMEGEVNENVNGAGPDQFRA